VACGRSSSHTQHLPSLFCQYQIHKNERCRGQYEQQLAISEEAEVGGHFEEGGHSNSETGYEPASRCWKTRESKATTVRKVEVQDWQSRPPRHREPHLTTSHHCVDTSMPVFLLVCAYKPWLSCFLGIRRPNLITALSLCEHQINNLGPKKLSRTGGLEPT